METSLWSRSDLGSRRSLREPRNVGRGSGGRCPRSPLLGHPPRPWAGGTTVLSQRRCGRRGQRGARSRPAGGIAAGPPAAPVTCPPPCSSEGQQCSPWPWRFAQPTCCKVGAQTASWDRGSCPRAGGRLGPRQAPCPPESFLLRVWGLGGPADSARQGELMSLQRGSPVGAEQLGSRAHHIPSSCRPLCPAACRARAPPGRAPPSVGEQGQMKGLRRNLYALSFGADGPMSETCPVESLERGPTPGPWEHAWLGGGWECAHPRRGTAGETRWAHGIEEGHFRGLCGVRSRNVSFKV